MVQTIVLDSHHYQAGTNPEKDPTAWQQPGPNSNDYRSDITTSATPAMLQAIIKAGINDGWSANGAADLENKYAKLCSREAAIYMVSSTMGNQISLRTHVAQPPIGVICDERSHIIHQEAGGMAALSGALPQTVQPSNGLYLTVEDIEDRAVLSDGSDACTTPTRMIHLENPLGGIIMPLKEQKRIKAWAHQHKLKLHMDGSRLFEAVAAGAGSLAEYCAEADSVNLCLTKGISAPVGSIVVGDKAFIHHARWVRKSVGGAMRQPGIMAACAWAATVESFGTDPSGRQSLLKENVERASKFATIWQQLGGRLVVPQHTNMVWLDLKAIGWTDDEWEQAAEKFGLKVHSSRIVFHYQQNSDLLLERFLRMVMDQSKSRTPLEYTPPRNDAVSRLAARMREAIDLSRTGGRITHQFS